MFDTIFFIVRLFGYFGIIGSIFFIAFPRNKAEQEENEHEST